MPISLLHGAVVFMTYTERGDDLHLISLRPATRHETRQFAYWVSRHR